MNKSWNKDTSVSGEWGCCHLNRAATEVESCHPERNNWVNNSLVAHIQPGSHVAQQSLLTLLPTSSRSPSSTLLTLSKPPHWLCDPSVCRRWSHAISVRKGRGAGRESLHLWANGEILVFYQIAAENEFGRDKQTVWGVRMIVIDQVGNSSCRPWETVVRDRPVKTCRYGGNCVDWRLQQPIAPRVHPPPPAEVTVTIITTPCSPLLHHITFILSKATNNQWIQPWSNSPKV